MAKGKKNGNGADNSATATAVAKPVFKLARKNKETGAIEPRQRGRPNPNFDQGYTDQDGTFFLGNPPKSHRVGRPPQNAVAATAALSGSGSGMGKASADFERIIQRELQNRMKRAASVAMYAFKRSLGV